MSKTKNVEKEKCRWFYWSKVRFLCSETFVFIWVLLKSFNRKWANNHYCLALPSRVVTGTGNRPARSGRRFSTGRSNDEDESGTGWSYGRYKCPIFIRLNMNLDISNNRFFFIQRENDQKNSSAVGEIREGLLTILEDIDIDADVNSYTSDHVCTITTEVIDIILSFRMMFVYCPHKDAKTTTNVLTRLLTYGVKFRPPTAKRRRKLHWSPKWLSISSFPV